jgi:predicted enzyme related to lactoylglutathione lyase
MFKGLRTCIFHVEDLTKAKEWYTVVLGKEPYFDQPYYVGFNVGGFELGLHPKDKNANTGKGGVSVYWGVDDARKSFQRLIELGAKSNEDIMDVGDDILVASVIDPFGNILGIIENPNFKFEDL